MCVEQNQWDNPYFKWWFHCQEKNEKTIGRKTLRGSDHISRGQNAVFFFRFLRWCVKVFFTVLKVMVRNGVSIGICQNSYWNLDARGTECVGRTIFSVIPRKMQNKKQLPERQLEHQSAFPLSNACFMFCFKCLSATLQKWEKNKSAYMGMFHTSYISLDVRTTECVGQKIRSVMFPVSKQC